MSCKKAQQALEYIITYGWGFIVVIVIIGALAYFGIFNPARYLPDNCDFGPQLQCYDYYLKADPPKQGDVQIKFFNNFGEDIRLLKIQTLDGGASRDLGIIVKKGEVSDTISLSLDGSEYTLIKGDKFLINLNVSFQRDMVGAPRHNILGTIYASSK